MKRTIITTLLLVLFTMTGIAQSAYSDLLNALYWSQNAANAGTSEQAASFASQAFQGGSNYNSGHSSGYSGYSYGTTITAAPSRRRSATNMSNVGLKISSSGYNRGAELARYYAEMRAERARLVEERRQRMVNSYMQTQYEKNQKREASWQMYIANNSQAKPFSQEAVVNFISNGLPGNVIIDDNGIQNMLPEALLEGTESEYESREILEKRLKNREDLSDEEWDYLIARKKEEVARLEEEKKELEESIGKTLVGLESPKDYNGHENTLNRNEIDQDRPLYVNIDNAYLEKENRYISNDNDNFQRLSNNDTEGGAVGKTSRDNRTENANGGSSSNLITEAYKVGSGFVKKTNDETVYINEALGITVPGSEIINNWNSELSDFESALRDVKEVSGNAFVGNLPDLASNFETIIKAEVIDPLKDKAADVMISLANKYTNTKNMIKNVGNPLKKAVSGFTDTILKGALRAEITGEYDNYGKEVYKGASRFDGKVARSAQDYLYNK